MIRFGRSENANKRPYVVARASGPIDQPPSTGHSAGPRQIKVREVEQAVEAHTRLHGEPRVMAAGEGSERTRNVPSNQ